MAATAVSLKLRTTTTTKLLPNPTFLHHFSSSPSTSPSPPNPNPETLTPKSPQSDPQSSSSSSYFSDVKASLRQQPRQPQHQGQSSTRAASLGQIRKDLAEFRLRSAAPSAGENSSPSAKPISFQELYKRNMASRERDSFNDTNKGGISSLNTIRESLRQLGSNTPKTNEDSFSLKKFKESFSLRPNDPRNPPFVIGSPQKIPESVFSKELKGNKEGENSPAMKTEFVKMYSYKELGEKLRKLRPEGKSEGGFLVQELNERLVKLREMEERETSSMMGNLNFRDLRESLIKLNNSDKKQTIQKLDMLTHLAQTPTFMLNPPKDHLVEKYFHPDNMSSAEKLKIELEKVRDEFKMSESDCGSARVQVAQLTTKIKHLATALHKKDKHSRKGLQGMIQQRKKLLKYLRRTDWDSYILVLSKLGLRDNPDYKN